MNFFMTMQINNMITNLRLFEDSLKLAALKDDGCLSKSEEKQLKAVYKATEAFRIELEKAKGV